MPTHSCSVGYLMCDGGACLPLFKKCDGTHDCMDLSDEQNCTKDNNKTHDCMGLSDGQKCTKDNDKVYSVTKYTVRNTNVSITVEWNVNDLTSAPDNLLYLLSYTKNTTAGDHVVWKNMTWTTNTTYKVLDLSPYTHYVLKVYIKEENGTKIFPPIHSVGTRTQQGMTGLAPGLNYTFRVNSYLGNVYGPETIIRVSTLGKKLLPVKSLQTVVTQEGTSVKLSWNQPLYKTHKVSWTYRIIWGKSPNDLKRSAHLTTTPNTTFIIHGLDACETYHVAVMVGEPLGIGPVAEKQVVTSPDAKAAPENVHAVLKNMSLMITWEVSCPQGGVANEQFMLFVTETSRNVLSPYQLLSQKNSTQSHSVQVHWGGRYSIQLKTAVAGAVLSHPVLCSGPKIPPPYELIYNQANSSISWRDNSSLPNEIARNHTYVLNVSKHEDMTDAVAYECPQPPLVLDTLEKGIIYHAAVALKSGEGYLSPWSQSKRFEIPIDNELVISQGSAVGVGVSVFLVVVALVVVVGVLAVRHRRLARSIISFTNTHYDSSQGTTLISTDHNLDEDDDSPMIRGFSDDEPLVIA
ncbi:Sortilin-related receptor [Chionoecetes opilio]|uniref:Sortilin-related receptor n=1 Tax=Chionoecetes opilio TaxID=41210 RepID=A0A8J5CXF6_CHIOP|nr:Sortilin-related receptor [Chionoecetes opilio]